MWLYRLLLWPVRFPLELFIRLCYWVNRKPHGELWIVDDVDFEEYPEEAQFYPQVKLALEYIRAHDPRRH